MGLGSYYARGLAKRGLNIILLARSVGKMEQLSEELKGVYKVQTMILAVDVTAPNVWSIVADHIKGLNVSVLINNVGGEANMGKCKKYFG